MIRQRQLQLYITITITFTITNSTHEYHNLTLETSGLAWETIWEYTINRNTWKYPNNHKHFKQPFLAWPDRLHVSLIHVVWNSALVSWLITHRKETDEQNEAGEFTFILHFEEGKKGGGKWRENIRGKPRKHRHRRRKIQTPSFPFPFLLPTSSPCACIRCCKRLSHLWKNQKSDRNNKRMRSIWTGKCDCVYWYSNKGFFLLTINEIKYQWSLLNTGLIDQFGIKITRLVPSYFDFCTSKIHFGVLGYISFENLTKKWPILEPKQSL